VNDNSYNVHHGDCIPHMLESMEPDSVDFSVFSPPFPSLYAYTDSESDIGNVDSMGSEAAVHFSFMFREPLPPALVSTREPVRET